MKLLRYCLFNYCILMNLIVSASPSMHVILHNATNKTIMIKLIRSDPKGLTMNFDYPDQTFSLKKDESSQLFLLAPFTGTPGKQVHAIQVAEYSKSGKPESIYSLNINDIVKKGEHCSGKIIYVAIIPGRLFGFNIKVSC